MRLRSDAATAMQDSTLQQEMIIIEDERSGVAAPTVTLLLTLEDNSRMSVIDRDRTRLVSRSYRLEPPL